MSSGAKLRSVEFVIPQGPGEGLHRPPGPDVLVLVEIDGRIHKAYIDIEELIKWNDALDDFPENQKDERVKAFVRENADGFVQIVERAVKEGGPPDENGEIRLRAADLAGICPRAA
ncbi:MAG: hypothetical protein OXC26_09580 [Albidovulum sp.]|nr:hypothetical protein [Albidovulum sp.]